MKKLVYILGTSGLVLLLVGSFLAGCAQAVTPAPVPTAAPTDTSASSPGPASALADGPTLMQARCNACHSTALIESARGTAEDWQMLVDRMVDFGAQLSPQEEQVLVQYLAQTYHP